MERGEDRSIAIAVLSVIGIVGILAAITLARQPTGLVAQGQTIYVTENAANLPVLCKQPQVIFLGYDANYKVYCCFEDMIGQNECLYPQKVMIR